MSLVSSNKKVRAAGTRDTKDVGIVGIFHDASGNPSRLHEHRSLSQRLHKVADSLFRKCETRPQEHFFVFS